MLELREVCKTYPGEPPVQSVRGVNLTVEPGDMLAIRGQSGSGKSTLLNLMSALDRPTSGSVRLDGQAVEELTDRELAGDFFTAVTAATIDDAEQALLDEAFQHCRLKESAT